MYGFSINLNSIVEFDLCDEFCFRFSISRLFSLLNFDIEGMDNHLRLSMPYAYARVVQLDFEASNISFHYIISNSKQLLLSQH